MNFTWTRQRKFLLAIALILLITGYLLMFYKDTQQELSEEIFNFRRITLAPVTVILGYVFIVFAIMKK